MCLAIVTGASGVPHSSIDDNHGFPVSAPRHLSQDVMNTAKRYLAEYGGRPTLQRVGFQGQHFSEKKATEKNTDNHREATAAPTASQGKIQHSFRHDGLASTLARRLRPIWKQKVTVPAPTPHNPIGQKVSIPASSLTSVQRDLVALKTFAESQVVFICIYTSQN
jgi:hypothetical protein